MKKVILFSIAFASYISIVNAQWQQTSLNESVYCFAVSGANFFAGTQHCNLGNGVYLSTNNGLSWTQVNSGLPANTDIYSLAISGTKILAGTNGNGVYISTNNGNNWTAVNAGLPASSSVYSLAVSGNYIFAGLQASVYLSTNDGANWSELNTGMISGGVSSLVISGTNIFAGIPGGGVYLSTNNGSTWTTANTGLTSPYIRSLAVCGTNIFAGTQNGMFISTNNGTSWSSVNNGAMSASVGINKIAVSGNNIFAGTLSGGVYLSTNNGTNWTQVSNGLPYDSQNSIYYSVYSLSIIGTNIFAGTNSEVWERPLSDFSGINEINENNSVSIFPNPLTDKITIIVLDKCTIEIANINGQIIKTINHDSGESLIDLGDLSSGVYTVRVMTDKEIVTKNIIKE